MFPSESSINLSFFFLSFWSSFFSCSFPFGFQTISSSDIVAEFLAASAES